MEIAWMIAIITAFVLGAYIRQPFAAPKRAENPPPPAAPEDPGRNADRTRREEDRIRQLNNMMNYKPEFLSTI